MVLIRCIIMKDERYDNQVIEVEDLEDLVDSYRKIIYISRMATKKPNKKFTLSEEQLYKIMNKTYDSTKTKLSE